MRKEGGERGRRDTEASAQLKRLQIITCICGTCFSFSSCLPLLCSHSLLLWLFVLSYSPQAFSCSLSPPVSISHFLPQGLCPSPMYLSLLSFSICSLLMLSISWCYLSAPTQQIGQIKAYNQILLIVLPTAGLVESFKAILSLVFFLLLSSLLSVSLSHLVPLSCSAISRLSHSRRTTYCRAR